MWKNILLFLSLSGLVGHHASPITKLYHHVDQKMSWTDAQRYCREQFHDLATIDNLEDLERLQASRKGSDYDIDTAWIGLYDDRTRWQWSYGNQDYKMGQHYDNWAGPEPNHAYAKQNCTMIMPQTGGWADKSCSDLAGPVCINAAGNYIYVQEIMTWYNARKYCQSHHTELAIELQKQRSTFRIKISTEADMTNPEVQRQFLEKLSAKMAKEGVTGVQLHLVVKDGQDQQREK
ncbi:unnamed protein product [Arctogadus glacialis]